MSYPAQEVLVTEHLTFAPLSLVDDIINTANALLYKSVNAMEQLFTNLPANIIPDEEVESGVHKFETLLENAVDRNFDAMELFVLRNIVNIPEDLIGWVQLKHHENLDFSTDDSAEIEDDLTKTKKTFAASQKVQAMLDRECRINERKLEILDKHAEQLKFLEDVARAEDVGSLRDSAGLLKEQIGALRHMIDETTKLAASLDSDPQASERSQYIEKVLLENVKEGSWETEAAETAKIGSVDDIQKAISTLKERGL